MFVAALGYGDLRGPFSPHVISCGWSYSARWQNQFERAIKVTGRKGIVHSSLEGHLSIPASPSLSPPTFEYLPLNA